MADNDQRITVQRKGPYIVHGNIPLVRKSAVISEHGEPLTWKKDEVLQTGGTYALCRCGRSNVKPFCDGSHSHPDFDGSEVADTSNISARESTYEGTKIFVKDDRSLCMHAGFCGDRVSNVWKMTQNTDDTQVRARIMSMIERCPSGALSYSLERDGENLEPDFPVEIAITPDGALWVTGGIPIERADGQPLEVRNRVTLCRCGGSSNKPLCDGAHKTIGFSEERGVPQA